MGARSPGDDEVVRRGAEASTAAARSGWGQEKVETAMAAAGQPLGCSAFSSERYGRGSRASDLRTRSTKTHVTETVRGPSYLQVSH